MCACLPCGRGQAIRQVASGSGPAALLRNVRVFPTPQVNLLLSLRGELEALCLGVLCPLRRCSDSGTIYKPAVSAGVGSASTPSAAVGHSARGSAIGTSQRPVSPAGTERQASDLASHCHHRRGPGDPVGLLATLHQPGAVQRGDPGGAMRSWRKGRTWSPDGGRPEEGWAKNIPEKGAVHSGLMRVQETALPLEMEGQWVWGLSCVPGCRKGDVDGEVHVRGPHVATQQKGGSSCSCRRAHRWAKAGWDRGVPGHSVLCRVGPLSSRPGDRAGGAARGEAYGSGWHVLSGRGWSDAQRPPCGTT